MFGDWAAAGSKDLATVAHEKVEDVLKNHQVTPIDADILKDMGMGVGGIPMLETPPIDAVTRASKAMVEIAGVDGI